MKGIWRKIDSCDEIRLTVHLGIKGNSSPRINYICCETVFQRNSNSKECSTRNDPPSVIFPVPLGLRKAEAYVTKNNKQQWYRSLIIMSNQCVKTNT